MSDYKIKFINHACFSVENDDESIIFDPWFFGTVFNDSWSLLEETQDLDLKKIKFIVITHEHPDHLHWPTLKKIKEFCTQSINVIFPFRKNKNVVSGLRKLGFKCAEIIPNTTFKIKQGINITSYPIGHDCAYVIEVGDKVILNQNDCYLTQNICNLIMNKHRKIDVWFMQFSLAGYYANCDDFIGLKNAKDYHKKMIKQYFNFFKPEIFVPFASFIYFCKEKNNFLNNWCIDIDEVSQEFSNLPLQILFYGDSLGYTNFDERNTINIKKWKEVYSKQKVILNHKLIEDDLLLLEANKVLNDISQKNNLKLPEKVFFKFYDKEKLFELDIVNQTAKFIDNTHSNSSQIAGILTSDDFYYFLKYPWGADTLNITSCFEIINKQLWQQILFTKDVLYER